jgi:8-oxo-dGTP pyrophosphatase MutT (NUDIX family)
MDSVAGGTGPVTDGTAVDAKVAGGAEGADVAETFRHAVRPPFGATVVVYRRGAQGVEVLVLHRAHSGADHEGDWAWTPPAGKRGHGEGIAECARRELFEETGLELPLVPTGAGSADWSIFLAEAPAGAAVSLAGEAHNEHDRFEWLPGDEAVRRCQPRPVSESLRAALALVPAAG